MDPIYILQLKEQKSILDAKLKHISEAIDNVLKTKEELLQEVDTYTVNVIQDILNQSTLVKETIRLSDQTDEFSQILQDIKLFSRNELQSKIISGLLSSIPSYKSSVQDVTEELMNELFNEVTYMLSNLSQIESSLPCFYLVKNTNFDAKDILHVSTRTDQVHDLVSDIIDPNSDSNVSDSSCIARATSATMFTDSTSLVDNALPSVDEEKTSKICISDMDNVFPENTTTKDENCNVKKLRITNVISLATGNSEKGQCYNTNTEQLSLNKSLITDFYQESAKFDKQTKHGIFSNHSKDTEQFSKIQTNELNNNNKENLSHNITDEVSAIVDHATNETDDGNAELMKDDADEIKSGSSSSSDFEDLYNYQSDASDNSELEVKKPKLTYSGINTKRKNQPKVKLQDIKNNSLYASSQEFASSVNTTLMCCPWRIALIDNYIWIASWDAVFKFNLNCQFLDRIFDANINFISSISDCCIDDFIVVASCHDVGITQLNIEKHTYSKIRSGSYTDISKNENDLIALDHENCLIDILTYNKDSNNWIHQRTIEMKHKSDLYWDRLVVYNSDIYISSCNNNCFYIYSYNGELKTKHGSSGSTSEGKLKNPRIAQVLPSGCVVLADTNNDRIQHCDNRGKWSIMPLPKPLGKPVDAVYDAGANNIWIVQHKPMKLLKYTKIWQL